MIEAIQNSKDQKNVPTLFNELQTGTDRQIQKTYNVSSLQTYEQSTNQPPPWSSHEGKHIKEIAAFTNFINPWNQEDQSIAIGFPLPHIPHFSIWGPDLGPPCRHSTRCSSLRTSSFACLVVVLWLWCHSEGLANSSSRLLYMLWCQTPHLPFCRLW